jgi:hypothetical protein
MMPENSYTQLDNIAWHCPEHGPKPIFTTEPLPDPAMFVRKYVKKLFKPKEGKNEHMWIYVDGVEEGRLIGRLVNVPLYEHGLRRGSHVVCTVVEIEQVAEGPAPDIVPDVTEEQVVVHIDPEADPEVRDSLGNVMLVPASVEVLLEHASRAERITLLGVTCSSRHRRFQDACAECAPVRASILRTIRSRWTQHITRATPNGEIE